MTPDSLFSIAGTLAIGGWASLLASPLMPRVADRIAGVIVPVLIAIAYSGIVLARWSGAEGGFGSLAEVAALFQDPWMLLAGWIHYLAFDLFIGAWEVRRAREEAIPFLLVVPCLVLTFLFGPLGLLLFMGLRLVRSLSPTPARSA